MEDFSSIVSTQQVSVNEDNTLGFQQSFKELKIQFQEDFFFFLSSKDDI